MTDETGVDAGGDAIAVVAPENTGADLSVSQAARALAAARHKPKEPALEPGAEAPPGPTELADEANAAPHDEATGETKEADPAEVPPLDLPRSWTKDRAEQWKALPRETQEYLTEQASRDSAEVRRSQNEAAEARKAVEAERKQLETARQQYEAKLPALVQTLQDIQAEQFPDIKTFADVQKMALEDPFRKIQWDTHQQKLQAVAWEAQQAEQRKAEDAQTNWTKHVREENAKFAEFVPELADKAKADELRSKAVDKLKHVGFSDQELTDLASGKDRLSIYDHRVQLLILDGLKYADVQKAKAAITAKPVPPVQRPGAARPPGSVAAEQVQASINRLNNSGDLKDAVAALTARRNAARRAS